MTLSREDRFASNEWALCLGPRDVDCPLETQGISSDLQDAYDPAEIAASILSYPGCRQVAAPTPGWEAWQARWKEGDRWVDFHQAQLWDGLDVPGLWWNLTFLKFDCRLGDILDITEHVRHSFPSVYLYDGITDTIHTPASMQEYLEELFAETTADRHGWTLERSPTVQESGAGLPPGRRIRVAVRANGVLEEIWVLITATLAGRYIGVTEGYSVKSDLVRPGIVLVFDAENITYIKPVAD